MSRRENVIDWTGPVADFAKQLRLLRANAGLTLRELARDVHYSTATLSVAASGCELPTWAVTEAFVRGCGSDPDSWRERWKQAAGFTRLPVAVQWTPASDPARNLRQAEATGVLPHRRLLAGPSPLPVTAETSAEFMDCLLRVKIWAGDPPVRVLAARAKVPSSTMQDFVRSKRGKLPQVETVCAFLTACGVDDPAVIAEWVYTWRRLKFAEVEQRRRRGRGRGGLAPAV
jgi:transcriptional regulator with XRE-family HTH domain